jgi:hypothetical protein
VRAQAWNDLIDQITAFDDAAATVGHEYVRVDVRFNQAPVPGARVAAVRLGSDGRPAGPPLEAAPADGAEFRLPANAPGPWRVYARAPGFAPWQDDIQVPGRVDPGPIATVTAELTATHVPVPDLAGFPLAVATEVAMWSGFMKGYVTTMEVPGGGPRVPLDQDTFTVLLHSPGPGTLAPIRWPSLFGVAGFLTMLVRPFPTGDALSGPHAPWRTVMPDLLGLRGSRLASALSNRGFPNMAFGWPGGGIEPTVVGQSPAAGEIVPVPTVPKIDLSPISPTTVRLGAFPGTHRKLADAAALPLVGGLPDGMLKSTLASNPTYVGPWQFAQRSLARAEADTIRTYFEGLGAPITDQPGEDLAAAWQSLHVSAQIGRTGG